MPSRAWKLRIQDILESISAIESYVAGMTFDEFTLDMYPSATPKSLGQT